MQFHAPGVNLVILIKVNGLLWDKVIENRCEGGTIWEKRTERKEKEHEI